MPLLHQHMLTCQSRNVGGTVLLELLWCTPDQRLCFEVTRICLFARLLILHDQLLELQDVLHHGQLLVEVRILPKCLCQCQRSLACSRKKLSAHLKPKPESILGLLIGSNHLKTSSSQVGTQHRKELVGNRCLFWRVA